MSPLTRFALAWHAGASLLLFWIYGWDKLCAKRGGRRVPEATLHLMALLGGWPGALIAQQVFRHKSKKAAFRLVFALTVLGHLALVGAMAYAGYRD